MVNKLDNSAMPEEERFSRPKIITSADLRSVDLRNLNIFLAESELFVKSKQKTFESTWALVIATSLLANILEIE